jgi:excisionase family DNA binding protein
MLKNGNEKTRGRCGPAKGITIAGSDQESYNSESNYCRQISVGSTARTAFSMRELAESWGISERSIWGLIKSGAIASFRVGRSVRISRDEANRFAERGGAS